jgi:hypothetical protein
MPTDCSADRFAFAPFDGRAVVAGFDGAITSDAGTLLLGAADRAIGRRHEDSTMTRCGTTRCWRRSTAS